MKGYIYKFTFPNGKVYIGQTRRPEEIRHKEHLSKVIGPSNPGLWEALQSFQTYDYEILQTIEESDIDHLVAMLNALETKYIYEYRATDPHYGYNVLAIGRVVTDKNQILKKEFNERLRIVEKESYAPVKGMCDTILDKVYETKEPLTPEEKEFVKSFISKNGVFDVSNFNVDDLSKNDEVALFVFGEAIDAAKYLFSQNLVDEVEYYINSESGKIVAKARDDKSILQIGPSGEIIREYSSLNDVAQALNVSRPANVWNALKGKQKTAYGFRWVYKKDFKNAKHED